MLDEDGWFEVDGSKELEGIEEGFIDIDGLLDGSTEIVLGLLDGLFEVGTSVGITVGKFVGCGYITIVGTNANRRMNRV